MNKELKQTLLAICQKYDIESATYGSSTDIYMHLGVNGVLIQLNACKREPATLREEIFSNLNIDLQIYMGGLYPSYTESATISATEMLARAAGVTPPSLNAKKQDLLDVYNAMRNKVYEQERAKQPAYTKLQELQQAFNIQMKKKDGNSR